MGKAHLKRLAAPRTWKIKRKGIKYVSKPNPGPHKLELCMPLNIILRDKLGYAKTSKEVKRILARQEVLVDGKRRKDPKLGIGMMDVLQIPKLKEYYRMLMNEKGYLTLLKIDKKEADVKPCKLLNKTTLKGGKIQLNLSNGINMLVDKDTYKCNDTLVLQFPKLEIKEHIKFEKGAYIYLSGGKHVGDHGVVEAVNNDMISYKSQSGEVLETNKRYALAIGKEKPMIGLLN